MRFKHFFLLTLLSLLLNNSSGQPNVRDSLKKFTISLVKKAVQNNKVRKLAVWDFTDINREIVPFGSYISELFSIYAENVDSIRIMDRQNLKSLLNEYKLKSEGFIDEKTIMELGKFSEVDAVVVGKVIVDVENSDFQVLVRILNTATASSLASDEQYFPIDSKMASIMGIRLSGEKSQINDNSSGAISRGFNTPITTTEQYNNAATVNSDCGKKNTGDYCFYNAYNEDITIKIYNNGGVWPGMNFPDVDMIIKSKSTKCIYAYTAGNYYFKSYKVAVGPHGWPEIDEGVFRVEQCKSKTYTIK
jgi:hypothetical protein